jgi:hypothetical protein
MYGDPVLGPKEEEEEEVKRMQESVISAITFCTFQQIQLDRSIRDM